MDSFGDNFIKLHKLISALENMRSGVTLEAVGFANVTVAVVERRSGRLVLRLSHFIERVLGGDPIPDPEMTIAVYLEARTAEVLTLSRLLWLPSGVSRRLDGVQPACEERLKSLS